MYSADPGGADICNAAAWIASRRTGSDNATIKETLLACAASAKHSGDGCEKHVYEHEHCRFRMESCRKCEQACRAAAEYDNCIRTEKAGVGAGAEPGIDCILSSDFRWKMKIGFKPRLRHRTCRRSKC